MPEAGITLGEFVKQLAVRMEDHELAMLFDDEKPWHMLFYRLHKERGRRGRPSFFDTIMFDWDGPTPKSPELSNYLAALHVTGSIGVVNPSFERIDINPEMSDLWRQASGRLTPAASAFLNHALDIAKEQFPKAVGA